MPTGDYRIQDKKVTPPPRARIDESMEALIHHFKIFTEGFKVPEGEVYVAVESPRGELGCYIVSDGRQALPHAHPGPSVREPADLPHLMRGGLIADTVAIVSSVDPIMGEVDADGRFNEDNEPLALEIIARYPRPKSATIPLLHLAQEQDGYVTDDAMAHIAELVGTTAAEVLGTCSFYEMFKRDTGGQVPGERLHQHLSCQLLGGEELLHHAERRSASRPVSTTPTGCSPSRTSSASPPAPRPLPARSTTATSTRSPPTSSTS
jgi:NADH:ubiquinone oxidoreductase subunit E